MWVLSKIGSKIAQKACNQSKEEEMGDNCSHLEEKLLVALVVKNQPANAEKCGV